MNYKALFLISLAANVGVGFYALRKSTAALEGLRKGKSSDPETLIASSAVKGAESAVTNKVIKRFNWESVESPDYKQYIANLRSVGCPEETIRDILRADVIKLYEEKKKQVRKEAPQFEYWKGDDFIREVGREAWMKMISLNEERDALLRALGIEPDYSKEAAKNSMALDWLLDFLGEQKKAQVLRMRRELEDRLEMREPGSLDPDAITRLLKETDDAIERLLTPEEALQYELTLSPTANTLRSQLSAFEPTRQEFVALFKLRKAYEEGLPTVNPNELSAAERRAVRETAEKQWLDQVRQLLGPQRYADYELAMDSAYQQMYGIAHQADLGAAEAKQAYHMRQLAEEQAARIRDDPSLTPEQRGAALAGIRQETEKSIHAVLGEKGWEQFNRGANNHWLDLIKPRSAAQPAAVPPP